LAQRAVESAKASAVIRTKLADGPLLQTKGITDSVGLWNQLRSLYEPRGFSSEFLTCKELFRTTLTRCNNSMDTYLNKIRRLTNDLAARNLAIPNKVIVAYVLNNLTPEYDHTVAIISQTLRTDNADIDLTELFSQLTDETRRLKATTRDIEMAMPSQSSKPKGPKGSKGPSKFKCSYCHKKGHSEDKCFLKHPELKKSRAQGNKPITSESEELTLATFELAAPTGSTPGESWYLDSAATRHICAYKPHFTTLEACNITLNWGKAGTIKVHQVGNIKIRFKSTGLLVTLTNCLYVPELEINLISLGQLLSKDIALEANVQGCSLTKEGRVIAKGYHQNTLTIFETIGIEQAYFT
jgi:gag-polypeptide of LTR copia-type